MRFVDVHRKCTFNQLYTPLCSVLRLGSLLNIRIGSEIHLSNVGLGVCVRPVTDSELLSEQDSARL